MMHMSIPDLVILEIRARPVVAPLTRPIRTASSDVLDAPLLLIDVLTDAGVTGRAYAFAYTRLTLRSLAQFVRDIAPEFVGKSVSPRARMWQMEKRLKLVGWQGFAGMVVGTLDIALRDALARAMDVPLAVLLGGELRPLPAYDSFGMLDPRTDLPWLEASVASGFKAIKIKLGAGGVESDVAMVADVRRTIGDRVRLMLDFNSRKALPARSSASVGCKISTSPGWKSRLQPKILWVIAQFASVSGQ
jgi:mandelate racemase